MDWRERDGIRWLEAELPGARAAFTTRGGGTSKGDFASLNLGILTDDNPEAVRRNRARAAAALDRDPGGVLIGRQVHGAEVLRRDAPQRPNPYAEPGDPPPEVDGQATATADLTALVFVADCLPIALAGERGVTMLHCGWRGLAAGIVARGAEVVGAEAAAIGPGIGPCCYEVGDQVLDAFAGLGDGVTSGRRLDLIAAARRLLERAGVERVEAASLCTSCGHELFFSHRRDRGRTGRQGGFAWIEGANA
ncbi:MAG TPA: polyphenol oxidase family protein [Solirubrobacterales bacterium]|nr:polyphenol oxidase family protein [Solirubrobacterales bacterium]